VLDNVVKQLEGAVLVEEGCSSELFDSVTYALPEKLIESIDKHDIAVTAKTVSRNQFYGNARLEKVCCQDLILVVSAKSLIWLRVTMSKSRGRKEATKKHQSMTSQYRHKKKSYAVAQLFDFYGAQGRNRTADTRIFNIGFMVSALF